MAFVPTEEEAVPRDPAEGFAAVLALRTLADRLEAGQVERAVREGWSWAEIATALGVSRQAVHKKHAKRLNGLGIRSRGRRDV
jgi:DNA-binding NarL/FixJ family response regulator